MSDNLPVRGDDRIASLVPFGLGAQKPHHMLEMAEVLWENRDSLPYAWRILNKGVCDGCSLGPRGLKDDVIEGTHLCTTRLKLLRLNTMPAFTPADVADIAHLRRMDNRQLQALGRIPCPLVYRKGDRGFRRISWDDALALAGGALRETPPERQAWFATSRGITNEVYYAFTKAARLAGTNNVDLCARLCHQATVSGLKATIGVGAPTCSLKDLIGTDLLLLWGTDIANNQPVTLKYLAHAKAQGTRIVVINPVREKGLESYWVPSMPKSALFGTTLMDDFIPVAVGGDIALLNGVLKVLVEKGKVDRSYVDAHTTNWEAVEAHVQAMAWDDIVRDSGVDKAKIEWLAELYARATTCVTIYSMGLTQHTFGTENVEAIVNLHLSRGMIGRPKTGILPIRGHSGVQGGGECGVAPGILPGGIPLTEENLQRFEGYWKTTLPRTPGLTTMRMVERMDQGGIDFLYNLGGNLFAVLPDPAWVADAYSKVKLRIHQDIVFNTSTVLEGADTVLVLPAQTRYEQRGGGTSTNTERRIRFSPEIAGHPQVGESRPEYEIPCQVVMAAFPRHHRTTLLSRRIRPPPRDRRDRAALRRHRDPLEGRRLDPVGRRAALRRRQVPRDARGEGALHRAGAAPHRGAGGRLLPHDPPRQAVQQHRHQGPRPGPGRQEARRPADLRGRPREARPVRRHARPRRLRHREDGGQPAPGRHPRRRAPGVLARVQRPHRPPHRPALGGARLQRGGADRADLTGEEP
jgi:molybdopterin-dependent oxidoreductase alpha subunit